jgi:hypothetical protein
MLDKTKKQGIKLINNQSILTGQPIKSPIWNLYLKFHTCVAREVLLVSKLFKNVPEYGSAQLQLFA